MLTTQRMIKVRIIAPKTMMRPIIGEMHRLKAIHIQEHTKSEPGTPETARIFDIAEPLPNAEPISELIVTLRALAAHLKIDLNDQPKKKLKQALKEVDKGIRQSQKEVNTTLEMQKILDEKLKMQTQTQEELQFLSKIKLPLSSYGGYKTLSTITGNVKDTDELKKRVSKATDKFKLYASEDRKSFALFIENSKKTEAYEILNGLGFSETAITATLPARGSAEINLQRQTQEKKAITLKQEETQAELQRLKEKWKEGMLNWEKTLSEELEKAEAPLKFASTKNIFIVTGWVPAKSYTALKTKLESSASDKIHIMEEEFEGEEAPIKLENPKAAKPFEFLIHLRGLPHYNEVDPTLLLFLSFPIFFGFMLGDIGYGLITFGASLILMRKMEKAKNLLAIIAISSITSIAFGFAFGEFFGEETFMGTELPRLISRTHEDGIQTLLTTSLILGVVHINIGLIMGFYNELRHHGLKQAILEKASWIMIELGAPFILSTLNVMKFPHTIINISAASLATGIIMLAIGELKIGSIGVFKAIVESITIFSNILSYARLMAVGLASVQLALIVNEFAKESFHAGGASIILGTAILLIGHTLNILLGLLGSFLHSLRLEYVEFFTKFFIGGAKPYKPFGETTAR